CAQRPFRGGIIAGSARRNGGAAWIRCSIFSLSIASRMQGAWRNSHAREITKTVFDPVVETDLCRLNSMGLLALATFSRDSENSLRSAGIRRANFRERSRTPRFRKICVPRAIEDVAA